MNTNSRLVTAAALVLSTATSTAAFLPPNCSSSSGAIRPYYAAPAIDADHAAEIFYHLHFGLETPLDMPRSAYRRSAPWPAIDVPPQQRFVVAPFGGGDAAMNGSERDQCTTLEQAAQTRPYKSTCTSEDFADDTARTNELLEQAGPAGITVPELRARGCGERPPNRICDLRKRGILIVTRRDSNGVTRYIKAKFLPNEKAERQPSESDFMRRRREELTREMPLFAGVRR